MLLVPKQALEDLLQSIASTQQCLTQVLQTATTGNTGNTGDTEQNLVSAPTAKRKAAVPRTGRSRSRERTPTGRRAKGRSKKEGVKKEEVKQEGIPETPEEEEEEETQPPATGKAAATTAKSAGEGPPATGKGKAGGKRPAPPPGPPPRGMSHWEQASLAKALATLRFLQVASWSSRSHPLKWRATTLARVPANSGAMASLHSLAAPK